MFKKLWATLCFFMTLFGLVPLVDAQFSVGDQVFPIETRMIDGVLVEYTQGLVALTTNQGVNHEEVRSLIAESKGEILRYWDLRQIQELEVLVRIPMDADPFRVANNWMLSPLVRNAAPNYVSTWETSDLYYDEQWALNQASDADIDAPEAWGVTSGSSSVIIAVLDAGVPMSGGSLTHEDLNDLAHLLLVSGADIYNGDNYPDDVSNHGTAVSGVTGAETNNGLGIAGVGYQCRLMQFFKLI